MLGMYGKVVCMLIATLLLGIGHIGIHIQHRKNEGRQHNRQQNRIKGKEEELR
jgi:hypothetical protein